MSNIKKNYLYQISYQLLNMALPFVTSPYISRTLGAEKLGIYSYTFSIVNMFIMFVNLGIEQYGSRMIAVSQSDKKKLSETFWELFWLRAILGVIVGIAYFIAIVALFPYKKFFLMQGLLLIGAIFDINWLFYGVENFKVTVTRNFVLKLGTVLCIFAFIKTRNDIGKYILIYGVGTVLSQSAVWCHVTKYISKVKVNKQAMRTHIKPLLILFGAVLAQSAYTYIDKIMIGTLSNMTQLGFTENAYKVVSFPMGVITSFGAVMLPRMSVLYNNQDDKIAKKYINDSFKYILMIAFGMMGGMMAVGNTFSIIFWGSDFATSGTIISIISPSVVFMSWSNIVRDQYLIPKAMDREYTVAIVLGAIVNLTFNALLVPIYGAIGAAIGTVFSYFSIALYQTFVTRKYIEYCSYIKYIVFYLFISVFMCFCVKAIRYYMGDILESLFLQVLIGLIIYGTILFFYLYKSNDPLLKKY